MISGCGFTIQKSRKLFREIVQHPLNAKILVLENKELYGITCGYTTNRRSDGVVSDTLTAICWWSDSEAKRYQIYSSHGKSWRRGQTFIIITIIKNAAIAILTRKQTYMVWSELAG